jgi:hypothetical protein
MPGVGGAVTGTTTTGTAAGGPQLGGGGASSATVQPAELPHNYFSKVGKSILVEGGGVAVTGTTTPTLKFGVYLTTLLGVPSNSGGVTLASTGAFTTVASLTLNWYFRLLTTCTATGSSGALQSIGQLFWGLNNLTTSVPQPSYLMGASSTTPVTYNTGQSVPVWVEPLAYWSATTTSLTMTMTNMFIWGLN